MRNLDIKYYDKNDFANYCRNHWMTKKSSLEFMKLLIEFIPIVVNEKDWKFLLDKICTFQILPTNKRSDTKFIDCKISEVFKKLIRKKRW
jgi:hypothetical protein